MAKFNKTTGTVIGISTQEDTLIGDYTNLSIYYPKGIQLQDGIVKNLATGQTILNSTNIDLFQIRGTKLNDILIGGDYNRNAGYANNPYDDDQLYGGDGDDRLEGRGGDDLLSGDNGNDILIGGAGKDEMHGGLGNDRLYGGAGDWLDDDSGSNHFYANEADRVTAGAKTTLHADYSNYAGKGVQMGLINSVGTILNGIGGFLKYDGGLAFDIKGSQYNDVIGDGWTLSNNDNLYGNDGNDVINASVGDDFIDGGTGNDILIGGAGLDKIYGGTGDDILNDTEGSLYGESGFDTLVADYSKLSYGGNGVNFNSRGSTQLSIRDIENFNIKGTVHADRLTGGIYDDIFDGGLGNDTLDGGLGNDTLFATYGSDTVTGGAGNDLIYAVAGVDAAVKQLYGGDGADKFILNVRGDVTLGLDFNTETLANFVNAITLPDSPGTDWKQLGTDIAFETAGAVLGAIPGVGPGLSFLASVAETGYGSYQQVQQITAQINEQVDKANKAAEEYKQADWGQIIPIPISF